MTLTSIVKTFYMRREVYHVSECQYLFSSLHYLTSHQYSVTPVICLCREACYLVPTFWSLLSLALGHFGAPSFSRHSFERSFIMVPIILAPFILASFILMTLTAILQDSLPFNIAIDCILSVIILSGNIISKFLHATKKTVPK